MSSKPEFKNLCEHCSKFRRTKFDNGDIWNFCIAHGMMIPAHANECDLFKSKGVVSSDVMEAWNLETYLANNEPVLFDEEGKVKKANKPVKGFLG